MSRKERWKQKQRQQVKEKMDKSVRAAQIYNELTRQNEARINASYHHHHSAFSAKASKEQILQRLKSCFYYPLAYAGALMLVTVLIVGIIGLINIDWVRENITFKKPVFEEYDQAQVVPIECDITGGIVSKSNVLLPERNDNYAKILCDKLGRLEISVFYRGNNEAAKSGAVQENVDAYFGFSGCTVVYGYHTTYFKNLSDVAVGDKITVMTSYGVFVYKVYKTGVEERKTSFDVGEESTIVLYTDEYSGVASGKKSTRCCYVYANLIDGPTVTD